MGGMSVSQQLGSDTQLITHDILKRTETNQWLKVHTASLSVGKLVPKCERLDIQFFSRKNLGRLSDC